MPSTFSQANCAILRYFNYHHNLRSYEDFLLDVDLLFPAAASAGDKLLWDILVGDILIVKDTSNCPMLPGISLVGEKLAGLTLVGDMLVGASLTGDKFSCAEPHTANLAYQPSETQIGNAFHGGHNDGWLNSNVTNEESRWKPIRAKNRWA